MLLVRSRAMSRLARCPQAHLVCRPPEADHMKTVEDITGVSSQDLLETVGLLQLQW